ncbi:S49 family peptidase [Methylobacterium brachiatum]|uniref:S49 family peptidase n=1 Tax=Methylobacterium brachiatum TaxID=269660 RepID=UPI0008ED6D39|nr:S49 family peptidase [Methylobacterium brachiatum]SFI85186.1 signal peptide peptidase SppA [Methylobacterium brachiatum]
MRIPLHRIAGQFYNRPLLLTPQAADTISNVLLSRIGDGGAQLGGRGGGGEDTAQTSTTLFPAELGGDGTMTVHTPQASRFYGEVPLSEDGSRRPLPYRRTAEGVAIITLVGEWVNRGGYVGASSGVISYEGFKYQLEMVGADARTKAVLLDMESPGGEAVGAFEAAAAVRRLALTKPVWALVNGLAASAAYAIASAATRIVSMPTGISGSIGVVLAHFDYSKMLENEGIKPTFIHAGANKVDANPYQALPAAVRDKLQAEVNTFYDLFVETVAAGRQGLTATAIRGTEAGTFMGAEALELGLIDALGTFESVLGEMSSNSPAAGRTTQGSTATMTPAQTAVAVAALATAGGAPAAASQTPARSAKAEPGFSWDEVVAEVNATLPKASTNRMGTDAGEQEPASTTAQAEAFSWDEVVAEVNATVGAAR